MKNVALIGMPLCGKTTVGKSLAESLPLKFVDTDALIERAENKTVSEIFLRSGEFGFRKKERIAVRKACKMRGAVIATGGGTLLDAENARLISLSAITVYLKASPATLLPRLNESDSRPLFSSAADPESKLYELFLRREKIYASCADYTVDIDGKSVEKIACEIVELLNGVAI